MNKIIAVAFQGNKPIDVQEVKSIVHIPIYSEVEHVADYLAVDSELDTSKCKSPFTLAFLYIKDGELIKEKSVFYVKNTEQKDITLELARFSKYKIFKLLDDKSVKNTKDGYIVAVARKKNKIIADASIVRYVDLISIESKKLSPPTCYLIMDTDLNLSDLDSRDFDLTLYINEQGARQVIDYHVVEIEKYVPTELAQYKGKYRIFKIWY